MTLAQLADASGVHRNTIANLVTDAAPGVSSSTIEGLARALGVEPSGLLRCDPVEDPVIEETWRAFLASPLAAGMSVEERDELRAGATWAWGPPTVEGWYRALDLMRAIKRGR